MPVRLCAWMAVLGVVCVLTARPGARGQANPQTRPTFRAGVDIVQIDVTVLGPDGRPVRGLTREDFTLLEDGEPQEILGFGEVNIPDASDGPAWLADADPDTRSTLDGRVFVFLLDDAQTPYRIETKTWVETVRRITDEVIDRMGPTDVAAVLCTYDKRCDQNFTNDRARLRAAIARFTPKGAFIAHRVSAGMAASLAKYLGEEMGRRRTIIYVTPRMPARPEVWPPSLSAGGDLVTQQQIIRTFEQVMRSRVTVYGISQAGLRPLAIAEDDDPLGPAAMQPARPDGPRWTAPPRSLALESGGFMISRPDQLADGVAQIFRETGSYYLLGYEPPPKKDTGYNMLGGFRSIEVRVNRPGLQIKTHRGYIPPPAVKTPANPSPASTSALAGILPKPDLPLRVSVAPFAVPGKPEAALAIVLGVREPASSLRTVDRLDVQFRAFTQSGSARGMTHQRIDALIPSSRDDEVLFEVLSVLRLKPGVYALRFSAESERLGKAGSVYADVEVPDFAKAPLSLSGVLITATPGPQAASSELLEEFVPVVPTTLRDFDAAHRAGAFLRVYQGGSGAVIAVTLTARVLDAANRVIVERTDALDAGRFSAARAADYRYDLALGRLPPGLYLLRITATAGANTARRDVRFTVR